MPTLSADTDLARALGDTFLAASDGADDISGDVTTAITLCEIESDLIVRCGDLSDDLNRSGIVVRQQADLIDGLEIDLEAFAEELDQDPDELAKQLEIITELGLGAEAGIIPLVLWEGSVNEPTLLREIFVGLPEPGVDPELDAALARMQVWLYPRLIDGKDVDFDDLQDGQIEDLELLGFHIGAGDTIIEVSENRTERRNGEDYRETVIVLKSVLEAGGQHLVDFISQAFAEDRGLFRLAGAPTIEDLIGVIIARDEAEFQRKLAEIPRGGDKDQRRRYDEARRRLRAEYEDIKASRQKLLVDYAGLDWLGAVLAGHAPPPTDAESRALLEEFATDLGWVDEGAGFDRAMNSVRRQRLAQDELVLGDPSEGKLVFNPEVVNGTIEFGLRIGAIDEAMVADAQRAAATILGVDVVDLLGDPDSIDLDAVPDELDYETVVQAIALRVDPEKLTENQLISALAFISGAETVGEQIDRIAKVILSFQTVQVAGAPVLTASQWKRAIGSDAFEYVSGLQGGRRRSYKESDDWKVEWVGQTTHLESGSEQFNWIVDHIGVPGYHKKRWNRTRLHLGVDGAGELAGFEVEHIPPKRSWIGVVFMAAFTAIAAFTGQYQVVYAIAAHQFIEGARNGDWLQGLASAAATILLAHAASGLASYVGTGAQAAAGAATYGFSTATSVASTVAGGIGLRNAIKNDDVVGGVVAGARLIGAGGVADVVEGVDSAVEGFEDGNYLAAAAGVFTAGAAGLSAAGATGLFSPEVSKTINTAADVADTAATVAQQSNIAVIAIEDGDYATAAIAATTALATAARPFTDGGAGAEYLGLSTAQQEAIASVIDLAQNGAALYGTVDAALRDDILGAIEILSARVAEVQGQDESLVGHYAHQLEEIVGVLQVIAGSEGATFEQLATALTPAISELSDALQPPPENLPLFKQPPPPPPPPLPDLVIELPQIDPVTGEVIGPNGQIIPASRLEPLDGGGVVVSGGGQGELGIVVAPGGGTVAGGGGATGVAGQTVTRLPDGSTAFTFTTNSVAGGQGSAGPLSGGGEVIGRAQEITVIYPPGESAGFRLDLGRPERLPDGYEVQIRSGGTGTETGFGIGSLFGFETGSELVQYDTFQRFVKNGDNLLVETGVLDVGRHRLGLSVGARDGVDFVTNFGGFLGIGSEGQLSLTRGVTYNVTSAEDLALLEQQIETNEIPPGLSYVERIDYTTSAGVVGKGGIDVSGPGLGGGIELNGGISGSGTTVSKVTTYLGGEAVSTELITSEGTRRTTVSYGQDGIDGLPQSITIDVGGLSPGAAAPLFDQNLPDGTYTARIELTSSEIFAFQQQLRAAGAHPDFILGTELGILAESDDPVRDFAAVLSPELVGRARALIREALGTAPDFDVDLVDLDGNSPLAPAGIP